MKKIYALSVLFCLFLFGGAQVTNFHDYSAVTINGDTVSMSQYYGKKVMVVNCASFCTYTPQYTPLDTLYSQYQQYGFEIVGFPSNDFLNQGGTDSEIISTCHTYDVQFQIMQTVHVASGSIDPIFQWLEQQTKNGVANATCSWNFNKFLVDEQGHWVRHFDSPTSPLDTAITNWIMSPAAISGIEPVKSDEPIQMQSANPTSNSIDMVVKADAQHFNISLFTVDGKLITSLYNGITTKGQQISYSVANLPSGMYIVKIQGADAQKNIKLIVQH